LPPCDPLVRPLSVGEIPDNGVVIHRERLLRRAQDIDPNVRARTHQERSTSKASACFVFQRVMERGNPLSVHLGHWDAAGQAVLSHCFARLKELRRGTVIWAGRKIVAVEINNGLYC
jgi:hypothetical protein